MAIEEIILKDIRNILLRIEKLLKEIRREQKLGKRTKDEESEEEC